MNELLEEIAAASQQAYGHQFGVIKTETAAERARVIADVSLGWVEAVDGGYRLTAKGSGELEARKRGQTPAQKQAVASLAAPAMELLSRMAAMGRQNPGVAIQLDGEEHMNVGPLLIAGMVERFGTDGYRLTAHGEKAAGPGQSTTGTTVPPTSADLLRRMADSSRSHFGTVFGAMQLDGNEHSEVVPLVSAGLVLRDGENVRLTQAGETWLYNNRAAA
jgi:hypothetical protein